FVQQVRKVTRTRRVKNSAKVGLVSRGVKGTGVSENGLYVVFANFERPSKEFKLSRQFHALGCWWRRWIDLRNLPSCWKTIETEPRRLAEPSQDGLVARALST